MKRQTFHVEKNKRSAMRLCMLIFPSTKIQHWYARNDVFV